MKTLRWALCGAGDICQKRVAPALRDLASCIPVSVSRKNPILLKEFADRFGFEKQFAHWKEQFQDPEIDAVYIATPVNLHYKQAIYAMEQGKHVLCEKPMALNKRETQLMADSARANTVHLGAAYYRRYYPVVRRIQEILDSGIIGRPVYIQVQNFTPFDRHPDEPRYWLLQPEISGGGPMMDMGCHRIELLLYLLGPVESVQSSLENLRFDRKVEDTSVAILRFKSNCIANISSLHAVSEPRDTLELYGTEGSIHIENLNKGFLTLHSIDGEIKEIHSPCGNAHKPLIEDFTQSILKNRTTAPALETALETTEILDRIYGR